MTRKKKFSVDYHCHSSTSGAVKDLKAKAKKLYGHPFDWPRWFDNKKKKRKVVVTIQKYFGDYHHWYAELDQEDNPFYLPPDPNDVYYKNGTWVEDDVARGAKFSERFNTEAGAKTYADLIMREHFPNHRPVIGERGFSDTNKTWHYSREGD